MARVELNLPEQFIFSTTLTVRMSDLNTAAHVGNDQMISLLTEALDRFFFDQGLDGGSYQGLSIVVTDLVTTYNSESFAREILQFEVGLMDFNKYGGDVIYRVRKQPSGKLVVLAKTGFVFFDHSTHNIAPLPLSFRQKFPSDWG